MENDIKKYMCTIQIKDPITGVQEEVQHVGYLGFSFELGMINLMWEDRIVGIPTNNIISMETYVMKGPNANQTN